DLGHLDVVVEFLEQTGIRRAVDDQHVGRVDEAARADGEQVAVIAVAHEGGPPDVLTTAGTQAGGRGGQGPRHVAADPDRAAPASGPGPDGVDPAGRAGAGADPRAASPAVTPQIRCRSHSAAASASPSGSPVATWTIHGVSRSSGVKARGTTTTAPPARAASD